MKCTGMLILSMMLAFSVGLVYAQDVADIAALADLNVTNITNLTNATNVTNHKYDSRHQCNCCNRDN